LRTRGKYSDCLDKRSPALQRRVRSSSCGRESHSRCAGSARGSHVEESVRSRSPRHAMPPQH